MWIEFRQIVNVIACAAVSAALVGCGVNGPNAAALRERTLSTLNVEADTWQGTPEHTTAARDAYGQPLSLTVKKTPVNYVLEVRSNGPDGLPKNSDDIVVSRTQPHGESTLSDQAANSVEKVTTGAASGMVKGLKKGLGLSPEKP